MASRDTRLIVDTRAIEQNARLLMGALGGAQLIGVVKADAYGHGIVQAARACVRAGVTFLAVATAEEGICLRDEGIECDILVLGSATRESALAAAAAGLVQTIYLPDCIDWLDDAARALGRRVRAHIQVDTGMRRLGIRPGGLGDMLDRLAQSPGVALEGIYSHFADASDAPYAREQFSLYREAAKAAEERFGPLLKHIASSGAVTEHPDTIWNGARCGIALYGYPPCKTDLPLVPAMSLVSSVAQIQSAHPGESVSYSRTYFAQRETRIATIPIGYGDGYARCIGNKGFALVRGRRAPVVGRVCMDFIMLDVTDIPGADIGDEVVLLGGQGDQRITAEDWAAWCDTIAYEVLLRPTARVPRVYL